MSDNDNTPHNDEHLSAYDRMVHRVRDYIDQVEERTGPMLDRAIERAKTNAHELGELTREEADLIGEYVRRDMRDAAAYLEESSEELGDWLRFDLQYVEDRLLEAMRSVADRTRIELAEFNERASRLGEWHTGEITGIGTLRCTSCGEELHFSHTGHIPPCPKCHGTRFQRVYAGE
jgi:NADH pyrophosphatase NudC (nudix superfamily)